MTRSERNRKRNSTIAILGISMALIVVLHALAEGVARLGLFSLALGIIPVLVVSQMKDWRFGLILGGTFGLVSLLTAVIKGYAGVSVWHNVINPLVSVLPRMFVGLAASLLALAAGKVFTAIDRRHAQNAAANEADADVTTDDSGNTEEEGANVDTQDSVEDSSATAERNEDEENPVQNATSTPSVAVQSSPAQPGIRARKLGRFTVEYLTHALITFICVILNAVGFLGMLLWLAAGETVPGGTAEFTLMYVLEFVVGTNTLIEAIVFTVLVPAIIQALKRAKVFR